MFTGLSATAMRRQAPRMRPPLRANVRWKPTHPTDWPIDRSHFSPAAPCFPISRHLDRLDHRCQPILIDRPSANLNLSSYPRCTWTLILEYLRQALNYVATNCRKFFYVATRAIFFQLFPIFSLGYHEYTHRSSYLDH